MKHHEQIDVLTFAIQDCVDEAMTGIRDSARNKNFLDEERGDILDRLAKKISSHVYRHMDEFDVNLYEIVGIIETIKQDIIMNDVVDVGVIGCLDAKKIEVISEMDIEFIFEDDDEFDEGF